MKHSSGEEAILPIDLTLDELLKEVSVDCVVCALRDRQSRVFKKVAEATGQSLRRQKAYYDRDVRGPDIAEGDHVRYINKKALISPSS